MMSRGFVIVLSAHGKVMLGLKYIPIIAHYILRKLHITCIVCEGVCVCLRARACIVCVHMCVCV